MTAFETISGVDDVESAVEAQLRMLLDSTAGTGIMHECVNAWNVNDWTRSWFGWANGLFGELSMEKHEVGKRLLGKAIRVRTPHIVFRK
ncbi:hypothetical protein QBC47DRAFT_403556 [Echria macrotheca]|uniref:Uncharacterized protein n=1 Tax=Echria macrotheca TaxID=438768 RepID=A0AAJ0FAH5_9PEZI|nr:hypothetical protein QBC47DRAFT_403556 [Echria macrotheca]